MESYKNTLDELMSKLQLKSIVMEGLLKVSRQMIYNYRNMEQLIDLPLSALTRILFYTDCQSISEFETFVESLNQNNSKKVKDKLEKLGGLLYNKNKEEKALNIQMLINGEITWMDIGRIGSNIKKEYPLVVEEKYKKLVKNTSQQFDGKRIDEISRIHIFHNLSDSYIKLLEDLLNQILKQGDDYELLTVLNKFIKNHKVGK